MLITLHKNARTSPAIGVEMASSTLSTGALARRFGVSVATASKWKKTPSAHDLSYTVHRLQITLSPAQERLIVELHRTSLMLLNDLLAVIREFVCETVSRSGLDYCLHRHGVGNLNALKPAKPREPHKAKAYEPGHLHMDIKDNGQEFTDCLFASREREATGQHEFDRLCADFGIEHRLMTAQGQEQNRLVEIEVTSQPKS